MRMTVRMVGTVGMDETCVTTVRMMIGTVGTVGMDETCVRSVRMTVGMVGMVLPSTCPSFLRFRSDQLDSDPMNPIWPIRFRAYESDPNNTLKPLPWMPLTSKLLFILLKNSSAILLQSTNLSSTYFNVTTPPTTAPRLLPSTIEEDSWGGPDPSRIAALPPCLVAMPLFLVASCS